MHHDTVYKEIILELNRHPLNKKVLTDFDVEAHEVNPVCGDDVTIRIKFDHEGTVQDIGFDGVGCAISQAAASVVTDEVRGKTSAEIAAMSLYDVTDLLGTDIIATRVQCALLALKTIQTGIKNYQ